MKKLSNQIMLITYSDSIGKNIAELQELLTKYVGNAIGGIHLGTGQLTEVLSCGAAGGCIMSEMMRI